MCKKKPLYAGMSGYFSEKPSISDKLLLSEASVELVSLMCPVFTRFMSTPEKALG